MGIQNSGAARNGVLALPRKNSGIRGQAEGAIRLNVGYGATGPPLWAAAGRGRFAAYRKNRVKQPEDGGETRGISISSAGSGGNNRCGSELGIAPKLIKFSKTIPVNTGDVSHQVGGRACVAWFSSWSHCSRWAKQDSTLLVIV